MSPYANTESVKDESAANEVTDTNKTIIYSNTTGYNTIPITVDDIWSNIDSAKQSNEIFAWYPHWFPNYYKKFDFEKINTVAYFSYQFNPANGKVTEKRKWETTPMIDSAKAHGCKVLLTVSSFGAANNSQFLNNAASVEQLIAELTAAVNMRNADGICIDFENIMKKDKNAFSSFVNQLSSALRRKNPEALVYLALPSVDHDHAFDLEALSGDIDRAVIMAYGYAGAWSKTPKPNSPIQGPGNSVTKTVDYYTQLLPPNRLLLGLPLYGCMWDEKHQNDSIIIEFEGYRTLSYINSHIAGPAQVDSLSKSAYIEFPLAHDEMITRKIWFNNEISFYYQIKLIKEKKLGGIGLWALGFEENCPLLWDVIDASLVAPQDTIPAPVEIVEEESGWFTDFRNFVSRSYNNIHEYHSFIIWVLSLVVMFGLLGFIISLFDYRTREFFTTNKFIRQATIGLVLICIVLIMFFFDNEPAHDATFKTYNGEPVTEGDGFFKEIRFISGFLVGIIVIKIVNWRIKMKKSRLP